MYCNGSVWNGTIPECKGDVYLELQITMGTFKMNAFKVVSQTCFMKSIDIYIIEMYTSDMTMNNLCAGATLLCHKNNQLTLHYVLHMYVTIKAVVSFICCNEINKLLTELSTVKYYDSLWFYGK